MFYILVNLFKNCISIKDLIKREQCSKRFYNFVNLKNFHKQINNYRGHIYWYYLFPSIYGILVIYRVLEKVSQSINYRFSDLKGLLLNYFSFRCSFFQIQKPQFTFKIKVLLRTSLFIKLLDQFFSFDVIANFYIILVKTIQF